MATTITEDLNNHVEEPEAPEENQTTDGPELQEFPPLFEDEEEHSEEELIGEPEEAPEGEEEAVTPPPEGEEEEPPEKDAEEGKPEEEGEPKDDKPPAGYVPLAALHEERGKRQFLAQEIETLKQELQFLKESPPKDQKPEEEFRVLSDQEFQELLEDDPAEAILYDRRLRVYEAEQARKLEQERIEKEIVDRSAKAMLEVVPDLYDPNSTTNQELSKFAVEQGFNEDYLPVLTDPRTKIIPPGADEPVLLGDVAVSQVKMLYNLYQKAKSSDRAAIEKEVTDRVTKEVTDRVTKEIMAKFKASPAQEYQSLASVPGNGDEPFDITRNLTPAQVDKLTPAQRRVYLGG